MWLKECLLEIALLGITAWQTYTLHLSLDKKKAHLLLEDMALQNQVDLTSDETLLDRREQRAKWPAFNLPELSRLKANQRWAGDTDPRIALETLRFVDEELWQRMDTNLVLPEDGWIEDQMENLQRDSQGRVTDTKGANVRGLIANAWYRARQQSAIWHIWTSLVEQELFSGDGVRLPISWYTNDMNVYQVAQVLGFFSGIRLDGRVPHLFPHHQDTENTWFWLAIQIVRSGVTKAGTVIDLLRSTKILGSFDELRFLRHYPNGIEWNHDPEAFSKTRDPSLMEGPKAYYAEWLPHSLGDDTETWPQKMKDCHCRFQAIEMQYYRYFSVPGDQANSEAR